MKTLTSFAASVFRLPLAYYHGDLHISDIALVCRNASTIRARLDLHIVGSSYNLVSSGLHTVLIDNRLHFAGLVGRLKVGDKFLLLADLLSLHGFAVDKQLRLVGVRVNLNGNRLAPRSPSSSSFSLRQSDSRRSCCEDHRDAEAAERKRRVCRAVPR